LDKLGVDILSFRELALKSCYDSEEDDVLTDFYIKVLGKTKKYDRLAGFFSSTALAIAAKGIAPFMANGGHMRLIVGIGLQEADVKAIIEGKENPEKIISEIMIRDLNDLYEKLVEDHVKALAWLVAKNQLEIKVAIVTDRTGNPITQEVAYKSGIFHQKVGIMEDFNGNVISFSGSINETAYAWTQNIEEFKVFKGWIDGEKSHLLSDKEKFEKYWNGKTNRMKIMDIPKAVRERLIQLSPRDYHTLKLTPEVTGLREYQKTAVSRWLENKNRGIFEMATGTGKTRAALQCLIDVFDKEKRIVTIISTPYIHLSEQWIREADKLGIDCQKIIADSSQTKWKDKLVDSFLDFNIGVFDRLMVLTTHSTFSSSDFITIIQQSKKQMRNGKLFLIVDEVHGIGAPERKRGLIDEYDYRLGLSATPKRWFDLEGTESIFAYFGDVVFEFTLQDAIATGYLTPYTYKPFFTKLTTEEMEQYEKETRKMSKMYYSDIDEDEKDSIFTLLSIKRQKIVRNARNKLVVFREILNEIGSPKYCLIYCSPTQIREVQKLLNEKGIVQHKFTQIEGTRPSKEYGGLTERDFLLQKFSERFYQVLVSMKCLDEGVDVPPARIAVMLDNSGNPREYIQRRGRVLRRYPGKEFATIFDILVEPILRPGLSKEASEIEKRIIIKELQRYREFANTAMNSSECVKTIESIESKYGL
jgi:superfamily II DNA or RNA helicase